MTEPLSGRALDAALACAFGGWAWEAHLPEYPGVEYLKRGARPGFGAMRVATGDVYYLDGLPHYSTDLDLMREIEKEIERRDLWPAYVIALAEAVDAKELLRPGEYSYGALFRLTHAPADVRARAALAVGGS